MKTAKFLKPTPWKLSISFCLLIAQLWLVPAIATSTLPSPNSLLVKRYLGGPFALMTYLIDPVVDYSIDKLAFRIAIAVLWMAFWYVFASLIVERLGKKK